MNNDDKTGLPEIPENHRWLIAPEMIYWGSSMYLKDAGNLKIELQKRVVEVEYNHSEKRFRWFRRVDSEPTPKREAARWETLYTETLKGANPIAARNAANRIMKRLAKDQIKQSLIGAYPPKSLGNVEDEK